MRAAASVATPWPSPDKEVVTGASSTPAYEILCVRTIQTSEPIPINVRDLDETPPDDEYWLGCLVPADELESNSSSWASVKHLPPIHVVGKTPDDGFYEVAVAQSRVGWLLERHFPFKLKSMECLQSNVWRRSHAIERIHGMIEAERRSRSCFKRNAVSGIVSGHGRGLDRYYRLVTPCMDLLAAIEWAILIRDILASPDEVLDQFLLSYLFLSLHLLEDLCGPSAFELLQKTREAWIKELQRLEREKTTSPMHDVKAEMHEVALLRGLLESAGGIRDCSQHQFDKEASTNDNLTTLGHLFGLDSVELVPYGGSNTDKVRDVLIISKPLGCNEMDVMKLQHQISLYVQIGFSDAVYGTLPASLINALGNGTMIGAQSMIATTFRQMPWLKKPENHLPLFLYYLATSQIDDKALLEWMASVKGKCEYWQIIAGLRETQTAEQFALRLTALLCYGLVLESPDEVSEPVNGSYLCDFFQHLNRHELRNRRAMWERMVCSFRRVVNCHPTARHWLDTIIKAELPRHWTDGFSDLCWGHRLDLGETEKDACEKARSEFDDVSKRLMASDWGMKEKLGEEWEIVDGTVTL